jgi:hypothetical protein
MAFFLPFLDDGLKLLSGTVGAPNQARFASGTGALRDSQARNNYSLTSAT